ncbi:pyruvate dehydrogenase complex dihydrolipoamide acetyltransferase [Luteolibacter yonseiensis]|uniref:Acetyltransferase component of pyruvate dehydrogenase complex n=1 Tax=Luteolibacter yonseiensis TaxID=1144680 RepID=A0A934R404_9BACT|nr:pyruvate dehydrogenase complex dihydrolipoamide acetyltransferase [Luteolibacter yonseiensis]MBK1814870.1 pyruvate dehydrogenase complex dihydrolipoamide acetyltransferase [Luteolibacter yonseiensis]
MSVNIEMPKLSDTMTEGTLIKWHKQVGDTVEIGDILAEVETDKATMEMEAFDDGVITEILVQEGEKAVIGGILAVLDGDSSGSAAPAPASQPAAASAPAAAESAPAPATAASPATTTPDATPSGDRIKASPLARKIAAETGVDLSTVSGSGPAGRIVKSDVESATASPKAKASTEASAAAALAASAKSKTAAPAAPAPAAAAILPTAKEGDERIELSSMRKVIASRLLTSKTTIPHFYLHLEVDAAPLMALRAQVNAQAEKTHGNKYSVNDFILKAVINAAEAVPAVNASYAGDHIVKFKHVGLSVAIAVEDGLVTPVIKQAESKSLLAISRAVKDFAVRAKDKKLKPDEFDGGTITVSNLGAWGIESFDAIVNPPQAAILSVGAAIEKPVVKNGQIVPGLRMNLGLSCDHRVVDGAVGAAFLSEIKKLIEQPALMLL